MYRSCHMSTPQTYLSSLLSNTPAAIKEKYFDDGGLGMRQHYLAGTSEMHNGLIWSWMALSEHSAGKWAKASVFEQNGSYTDRTHLPLPKAQANKQVIVFAAGGSTNTEFASNFMRDYAGCDSYVEFDADLSHHPQSRMQKNIFDKVGAALVGNYPAYKNANAASFEKLCDAMKADGVGINFIGDSAFTHWASTYEFFPADMQNCTAGGGVYKILDVNQRYYETLDNIFTKMVVRQGADIRLVE